MYSCTISEGECKETVESIELLKVTAHSNASLCEYMLQNYNSSIYHCKKILENECKNETTEAKAHYRLGIIFESINNLELSLYHFNRSLVLKSDKTTYTAYQRVKDAKEQLNM